MVSQPSLSVSACKVPKCTWIVFRAKGYWKSSSFEGILHQCDANPLSKRCKNEWRERERDSTIPHRELFILQLRKDERWIYGVFLYLHRFSPLLAIFHGVPTWTNTAQCCPLDMFAVLSDYYAVWTMMWAISAACWKQAGTAKNKPLT